MTDNPGRLKDSRLMNELLDYSGKVFRICLGFSRNPWDAEELTQEIYLKAMKKIGSLKNQDRKREWLFRIARNTCLNHCRRERLYRKLLTRMANHSVDHNSPEWRMIQTEEFQALKHSIHRLQQMDKDAAAQRSDIQIPDLNQYPALDYKQVLEILFKKKAVFRFLNQFSKNFKEEKNG